MSSQAIEGIAYFATYLIIIIACTGLWFAYSRRRYMLAAILALGGATALAVGLVASSQHWRGGIAFFDLDAEAFAKRFLTHFIALLAASAIAYVAFRMYNRALLHRTMIAHGLLIGVVIASALSMRQMSAERAYTLQGDSAIPIMSRPSNSDLSISVPEAFTVRTLVDSGIASPTAICFSPDDFLYISDIAGHIWRVNLASDTTSQAPELVTDGLNTPLGLAWHEGELFVSSSGRVDAFQVDADGGIANSRTVIEGLPAQIYVFHQNNQIVIGPDERIYVGVGATSDAGPEDTPLAATIVSFNLDGSDLQVVATGVRNAYGIAFDHDGQLWATDNGPAHGFETSPPEELNAIDTGKDYGFPASYYTWHPEDAGEPPVAVFPSHSSVDGIGVYPLGTALEFPDTYKGDLFMAAWGNGRIYRVQVEEREGSYLQHTSVFASGFRNPLDVKFDEEGRMYIADYGSMAIYVVEYE
jgi:glucose/arabinose dehydrogenase